jgi:hypothetical protein
MSSAYDVAMLKYALTNRSWEVVKVFLMPPTSLHGVSSAGFKIFTLTVYSEVLLLMRTNCLNIHGFGLLRITWPYMPLIESAGTAVNILESYSGSARFESRPTHKPDSSTQQPYTRGTGTRNTVQHNKTKMAGQQNNAHTRQPCTEPYVITYTYIH